MPAIVVPTSGEAACYITNLVDPLIRLDDLKRIGTCRQQVAKDRVGVKRDRSDQ